MKKGLITFLISSVICLAFIVGIAIYVQNYILDDDVLSLDAKVVHTATPTQAVVTKEPDVASSQALAVTSQALDITEEEIDEEEPELPDVTPEPDMDPDTWDFIKGGDYNMRYTDKEKAPKVMPYEIHVNKQMNCITVYEPNKKGKYTKPVKAMVCSAGSATPLGTFKTSDKYYWKALIHDVWGQYSTRITGKILFHSVPYDTHEKDALITSYYNQLGSTASAGCVRLSVEDAKWIIENCPAGTTVVIYNSSDPGPLGKPKPIRITANTTWDPTDPDKRNPWNSEETKLVGVKDRTIERCQSVNFLDGVTAFDVHSKQMDSSNIKVSSKLNSSIPGKYTVKYSFKDSKGNVIKEKASFTVVDTLKPSISGISENYYVQDAGKVNAASIIKMVTLTDNGKALDKKKHLSVNVSGNTVTLFASDAYGHTVTMKSKIIEDKKAPELKIKSFESEYPVSRVINEKWARNQIAKVSDNVNKLKAGNVRVSVKPSGWGMKISYSVKDSAGNKTVVDKTVAYEKAVVSLQAANPVVSDIKDNDELDSLIAVTSASTGKDIDYKLKVKREKVETNDMYKVYNVTYYATYRSSAGTDTATLTTRISTPR